ncbi:MAG TPA: serine/threonine-protein kinase [Phycisphaerae bacterium]|nr:serine/threonine-protein kinase [Phycisphaerae bacterium]HRW52405.1 serine/threonine-protein kinase [Phycisphaerae bacterium]
MTDTALHERATSIFGEAIRLSDADRRDFLDRECAGNTPLRTYVDRLLAHDSDAPLAPEAAREVRRALRDALPRHIDGYEIIDVIGGGGMGIVYRARQESPSREVAIKILHHGVTTSAALERFVRESELLARLAHPNVARVFHAGVSRDGGEPAGRPYFVMELIDGVTLDNYLASRSLPAPDRVRLLLQICAAVEHAHQRGVIHRDIKPSNVLIDGQDRAVLVDFGIAKCADTDIHLTIAADGASSLLGTLAYMSPEQLSGDTDAVDTRSDVYSLGALAYEALCGRLPYDIEGRPISRVIAAIERDDPIPLRRRNPALAEDLDRIVSKAMRKKPDERYPSVSALSDDLARWLDGMPVEARGRSALYVASKFARRHQVATLSAIAATAAIAVALVLTSTALVRAERSRKRAEAESERAKAMSKFLEATVFGADPEIGGASMTFLDAIAYTSNRIPGDLAAHPELQADAHALVGFVLRRHGRYADAESHLRQAYRLRTEALGDNHPLTAESMKALGDLSYEYAGRPDEATQWIDRAMAILAHGDNDPKRACWLWYSLAFAQLDANRIADARRNFQEAIRRIESSYENLGVAYAGRAMAGLALCELYEGGGEAALRIVNDAIGRQAEMKGLGQEYPLARMRLIRSAILMQLGRFDEASAALKQCETSLGAVLESGHPIFGEILAERSRIALASGDDPGARREALDAISLFEGSLSPTHWRRLEMEAVAALVNALGTTTNLNTGPFDLATERLQTALGGSHPRVIWFYRAAANAYERAGFHEKADFMRHLVDMRLQR